MVKIVRSTIVVLIFITWICDTERNCTHFFFYVCVDQNVFLWFKKLCLSEFFPCIFFGSECKFQRHKIQGCPFQSDTLRITITILTPYSQNESLFIKGA